MTLIRSDRLKLLKARRGELLRLIDTFQYKPGNENFIKEVEGRIAEIDQHIADVELFRA